jgi:enterochelin esterase-like enzyme
MNRNGKVLVELFCSEELKGNPLGDPWNRKLVIYLPPSYEAGDRFPVVYALSGFMGFGAMFLSPQAWGYSLDERCDKLISEGSMKESIVVMPDCFTKYGGSQYVNSSALGSYEDYLIKEIVPYIDRHYHTLADAGHRAVIGKSSGGYGALRLSMKFPEIFSAFYCSSGDMYFEYVYKPDLPKCYNAIYRAGGLDNFFDRFFSAPKKSSDLMTAINIIAMAAAYSPNPDAPYGFDLPFDLSTGEIRSNVWKKWLEWDPVYLIEKNGYPANLKKLKGLFFDCGSRDEYHLHIGARILTKKLKALGITYWYEEFDDGHMGTNYRYDISLNLISHLIAS